MVWKKRNDARGPILKDYELLLLNISLFESTFPQNCWIQKKCGILFFANNIIAADASRASMLDAPITGCLIEPLTSTARQNFLLVGATKLKAA
jgi:hypothetical protein